MSKKGFLLVVLSWAIIAVAVGVYFMTRPSSDGPLIAASPTDASGAVPTPEYLFEHPDVFKEAEQKCQRNSDPSSLYCSNVQRAESLRMADQYRRAAQPKGAAK